MIENVKENCDKNGVKLIYLTKFGSHLYGTNTSLSDTDYKGIFLPSKEQLILQDIKKSITYSTSDKNDKNSSDDIDVQLWSLQYFLHLVSKGETNALDLLFSFTYPEMIEYSDFPMELIHQNYDKLFNIRHCKAFVRYAIGQAKKYGIKGSRLGVLKRVYNLIPSLVFGLESHYQTELKNIKFDSILNCVVEKCYDSSYCFKKMIGKEPNKVLSLVLCGKVHQGNIGILEFVKRVEKEYTKYGKRAEEAENNKGIDWKALSHAVRALTQMKQLIETGKIQYPLSNAKYILSIKLGKKPYKEVEKLIYNGIEDVDRMLKNPNLIIKNTKNKNIIKNIILEAYNE